MKKRRCAAFTLVEILVAACLSSVVGLVIYGVASETLVNFARNVSINRSYSNGRQTLDRIAIELQSAGHTPVPVNSSGADIVPAPAAYVPVAGVRFWRYSSTPVYDITTPTLTATTLALSLIQPGTTSTVINAPAVGDLITIAILGFQAQVTSVSTSGSTATVTFSGTMTSDTTPVLTAASLAAASSTTTANAVDKKMTCLDWRSVAFIAINNQLRYYPTFISGTTNVNTPANYQVLSYLTASLGTVPTPLPFSLESASGSGGTSTSAINVDLYAEAPDYNNRTTIAGTSNASNGLSTADTYTYLQTALAPRNPGIIGKP